MFTQIDMQPVFVRSTKISYNWACEKILYYMSLLYNVYYIFLFLTDTTQVTRVVKLILQRLCPKEHVNF